jgi:hypothetical protein
VVLEVVVVVALLQEEKLVVREHQGKEIQVE